MKKKKSYTKTGIIQHTTTPTRRLYVKKSFGEDKYKTKNVLVNLVHKSDLERKNLRKLNWKLFSINVKENILQQLINTTKAVHSENLICVAKEFFCLVSGDLHKIEYCLHYSMW